MVVSKKNRSTTGLNGRATGVFLLGLFAVFTVSCGGGSSQQANLNLPPQNIEEAEGGSFPSPLPSTLKELSYLLPDLDNRGSEFVTAPGYPVGRVETDGTSAIFSPDWAEGRQSSANLAFATYAFNIPGYDLEQSVTFEFSSIGALSDAWVGIANYAADKWDWFSMPEGFFLELAFQDYLHPETETMVVLPLFMGTEAWTLDRVQVGPGFGEGEIRVLDGYVYEIDGSTPKQNVEISITGDNTLNALTDLAGYWIEYFAPEGNYSVTPYEYSRRFFPPSRDVTLFGENLTVEPFLDANVPLYPAHGLVLWPNGITPMQFIDIEIEGDDHGFGLTDGDGIWSANLPDGSYTVRPFSEGWAFIPESREFTIAGGEVETERFVAEELRAQRVEGFIFLEDGVTALRDVVVYIDGEPSYQKTTDIYGYWRVMEIYRGSYRITPFMPGMVFEPEFVDVDITDEFVELEPFIASQAPQSTVSGTVVEQGTGDPVDEIPVTVANRFYTLETATAPDGGWSVTGVAPGTYTVTAQAATWNFVPNEYSITVVGTGVTVDPFTATRRNPYAVFGYILDEDRLSPLGDIDVWLTGDGVYSATSGADGFWIIPGVLEGNYLVQPLLAGREFEPRTQVITVDGAAFRVDDFSLAFHPRHSVSGFIWTDPWPTPFANALVTVANVNFWYETTTDSEGNWQIDGVLDSYYYIWGESFGYTFDPLWVEEPLDGEDIVIDPLEAIALEAFLLDGLVFEADGSTPLPNAIVSVEGSYDYQAITDTSGYWSIANVFEGEYEVAAEILGWIFTPQSQDITVAGDTTADTFFGSPLP